MVLRSSAAFFLKAVCVFLDTRIMMFLSFLIEASVYILLYMILGPCLDFVKCLAGLGIWFPVARLSHEIYASSSMSRRAETRLARSLVPAVAVRERDQIQVEAARHTVEERWHADAAATVEADIRRTRLRFVPVPLAQDSLACSEAV